MRKTTTSVKPSASAKRKERERLAHRNEIVEAAERVFARDGYHRATIERTAKEAGFAVGTIYNFFPSKEILFSEVVFKMAQENSIVLKENVFSQPDPLVAVQNLIEQQLMFPSKRRAFCRMFLEASPGGAINFVENLPPDTRKLYNWYLNSVIALLKRGMKAGVVRKVDPFYLAQTLDGGMRAMGIHWLTCKEPPTDAMVAKAKNILLALVCEPRYMKEKK